MSDTNRRAPAGATGPGMGARMGRGGPGMGGPGGMMMGGGAKAKNFKGTLRRLVAYMGQYRLAVIGVWVIALASTVFSIAGPKILGKATTRLFEGVMAKLSGKGEVDFRYIGTIILFTLGLYLVSAIFSYIQGWVMSGISVKITYRFRKDISEKMDRMPLRYFDGTNHGEVLSRITNDVDVVNQSLSQSLTQLVTSMATVLGVIIMMFTISWRLTLVALVIMPVSLAFVSFIIKKSQKLFKEQQEYLGDRKSVE